MITKLSTVLALAALSALTACASPQADGMPGHKGGTFSASLQVPPDAADRPAEKVQALRY